MQLVINVNAVISALNAVSKTRELLIALEPDLLTLAFIHKDRENYEALIVEQSAMKSNRVTQFIHLLFQVIEVVPAEDVYKRLEIAEAAIGDTDSDDVLYLPCACAMGAATWSDESDFDEQDVVEPYSTSDMLTSFDTIEFSSG